jgi:hypothetical protein
MPRYPIVYSLTVLPLSIVRWITFSKQAHSVPSVLTLLVVTIFGLSGAANVFLLVYARPGLLLLRPSRYHSHATSRKTQFRTGSTNDAVLSKTTIDIERQYIGSHDGRQADGEHAFVLDDMRRKSQHVPRNSVAPSIRTQNSEAESE